MLYQDEVPKHRPAQRNTVHLANCGSRGMAGGDDQARRAGLYAALRRAAAAASLGALACALALVFAGAGRSAPAVAGRDPLPPGSLELLALHANGKFPALDYVETQLTVEPRSQHQRQWPQQHAQQQALAEKLPVAPHHCESVGPQCCDAGAPFECCCGQFAAVVKNKTLVRINNATTAAHAIPQLPHQCNETGQHCCTADAPFTCCCSMFKEAKHQQRATAVAADGKPVGNRASARAEEAPAKGARRLAKKGAKESIAEEAIREVDQIKALENANGQGASTAAVKKRAIKTPAAGPQKDAAGKRPVKTGDKAEQRAAAETRRAEERKEIRDALHRMDVQSSQQSGIPMPAGVKAVQKFARAFFGHNQRDAALRKKLEKEASMHVESADGIDVKEHVSLGTDGRVHMSRKGPDMNALTMKALDELKMDETLTSSLTRRASSHSPSQATAKQDGRAKTTPSDTFRAPSDASARAWQPPSVDFSNLGR